MSEQDEEYFWRSQVKADVLAILQKCKEDGVCDDESIAASVADAIPSPDMVEQILQENTSLRARVAELEGAIRDFAKYLPPEVNERARAVLAHGSAGGRQWGKGRK